MSTIGLVCTRIFFIPIEEETAHTHDLSIKGNNMKNKKMAVAGISLLGSIGVISTGFAGWIIGAPSQKGEGSGSITADGDVTTLGLEKVTEGTGFGTGADGDAKIVFGANAASKPNGWLTADLGTNEANKEDLKAEYTFVVKYTNVTTISVSDISFVETGSTYSTLMDKGETSGVVGALPTLKDSTSTDSGYITISKTETGNKFEVSAANNQATLKVNKLPTEQTLTIKFSIGFAWGAAFNHKNPMDYYNDGTKTKASHGADASEKIAKLKTLTGAGFTHSFTVSAK